MHIPLQGIIPAGIKIIHASAVTMMRKSDANNGDSKSRYIVDGAIIIFLLGVSFQAGIQYNISGELAKATISNAARISALEGRETPTSDRLEHVETMLTVIHDQLLEQAQKK